MANRRVSTTGQWMFVGLAVIGGLCLVFLMGWSLVGFTGMLAVALAAALFLGRAR